MTPDRYTIAVWRRRFWLILAILLLIPLLIGVYLAVRFLPDRPVTYANIEEHFKYGSTGGERNAGFPYYIFKAMPVVCKDYIPKTGGNAYEAFGFFYEKGKDLPVGMMKRRNLGIDRVFVNCAVCHHGTVRTTPDAEPKLYLGMGAAQMNLGAFETFLFQCAADEKFRVEFIVPEVERLAGGLNVLDRNLVYPVAISLMRARLLMLSDRFAPTRPHIWGPGRVDTFNPAKALFNYPFAKIPKRELVGAADFPSIWLQRPREGMWLHWDGNNNSTEERNKNAAFGTGTTPSTIDLAAIKRIEDWLWELAPPPYPYPIDQAAAARGKVHYDRYCIRCHGKNGRDFTGGSEIGKVTHIDDIKTDRGRLDSFTYDVATNLSTNYADESYRFTHFRKTYGYANAPLDGIWLRGPYLHNGSVPTLRALLDDAVPQGAPNRCTGATPANFRPNVFYRGSSLFDPKGVGYNSTMPSENVPRKGIRHYFRFDTCADSNGNWGHEGEVYGTKLAPNEKDDLVEYLKTF